MYTRKGKRGGLAKSVFVRMKVGRRGGSAASVSMLYRHFLQVCYKLEIK